MRFIVFYPKGFLHLHSPWRYKPDLSKEKIIENKLGLDAQGISRSRFIFEWKKESDND